MCASNAGKEAPGARAEEKTLAAFTYLIIAAALKAVFLLCLSHSLISENEHSALRQDSSVKHGCSIDFTDLKRNYIVNEAYGA